MDGGRGSLREKVLGLVGHFVDLMGKGSSQHMLEAHLSFLFF